MPDLSLIPQDVAEQAIKLAAMPRTVGDNPFSRRRNAEVDFEKMELREAALLAVHDCYNANFGKYKDPQEVVRSKPKEYLEQPGRIAINILRLFVDTISVSYAEPPQRVYYRKGERVADDDPILLALSKRLAEADYDRYLDMIDKWMRLFGNVVGRPIYDPVNDALVFQAYPGYLVRVVENPRNPRQPFATVVMGSVEEIDDKGTLQKIPTAEVWTPVEYIALKDNQQTQRVGIGEPEYNYEFVPLVHCFDSPPFGGRQRYHVNAIGWPLAAQNVRLNEDYFSQYIYAALMQAIGILVVKGAVEGELVISPGRAMHFPSADDLSGLSSVSQGAMLEDFRSAIEFIFELIRESYGIPKSLLDAEVSSSGQAIIQANAPIAELRKHRQPLFAKIETDFLRATLQELRGRADGFPMTLDPTEWEVSITYPDATANIAVNDEIAKDKHLLEIGVITPGEILMREKPGQFDSVEEADKWLAARQPQVEPGDGQEEPDTPEDNAEPNAGEPALEVQTEET